VSRPMRIYCNSLAQVPSADNLCRFANADSHVVLQFASLTSDEKSALINRLASALPDHSVFYSGGSPSCPWITILRVVSRMRILENRESVLDAVQNYRELTAALSKLHHQGSIPREWRQGDHGGHCRCENRLTGQVVESPSARVGRPKSNRSILLCEICEDNEGVRACG